MRGLFITISLRFACVVLLGTGAALPARADAVAATDVSALLPALLPAVVSIATVQYIPALDANGKALADGSRTRKEGVGSGFIIDPDGVILTNRHDTDGADEIDVLLYDGTRLRAALMYRSAGLDLAMLRVHPAQQLPAVQWGDSTRMLPGMPVIAIGNPLGLGFTVTHGIVSARDRDIRITELDNFIQIDAAINPGNSGGPLFNISGELVGMNTAFFTPGEERGSVGLGFAVPGNELQFVVNELRRYGRVRLGTIGVEAQDLDQDMADAVGLPRPDGVVVFRVAPGTPADTAELRVGDIILTLAGRDIANVRRLRRTVAAERIGATVPVEILRDGARLTLPVTIAEAPIDPAAKYVPDPTLPARARPTALGLAVAAIPQADRSAFGLSAQTEGVVVTHVMPKTIATDLGLAAGNVILRVNSHDITSPAMLAEAIDDARARGRPTMMMLLIDGKGVTKWMAVPVPPAG